MPLSRQFDKNEYESLFFDCVECVRKEVARRKLKGEMLNKRAYPPFHSTHRSMADQNAEDVLLSEGGVMKITKLEELKQSDRIRILDLFVNSEKIITQVFDLIFPSKLLDDKKSLHPRGKSMSSTLYQDGAQFLLEASREEES